jgi:ADP-heptose:LPS heptosyltransferase
LGDAVLTLPVLQALRAIGARRFVVLGVPGHWRWLRASGNNVTVADWGGVEWLGLSTPEMDIAPQARRQLDGIEVAVVYLRSGLAETATVLRTMGIREVLTGLPPIWPEQPNDVRDDRHAAERLLVPLCERTGVPLCTGGPAGNGPLDQSAEPFLRVTEDERAAALKRLGLARSPGQGFFAVHPGSGGTSKCWPAERYLELLRRAAMRGTSAPLVFLGPAEERTLAAHLRELPEGTRVANSFPLREVLALLSMSRVFVGNDAGVTHLAARCCPTVQLFGATKPSRWKALGANVTAVQAPDGKLERLEVDTVWEAARDGNAQ